MVVSTQKENDMQDDANDPALVGSTFIPFDESTPVDLAPPSSCMTVVQIATLKPSVMLTMDQVRKAVLELKADNPEPPTPELAYYPQVHPEETKVPLVQCMNRVQMICIVGAALALFRNKDALEAKHFCALANALYGTSSPESAALKMKMRERL